jgi:hypothetical protein
MINHVNGTCCARVSGTRAVAVEENFGQSCGKRREASPQRGRETLPQCVRRDCCWGICQGGDGHCFAGRNKTA